MERIQKEGKQHRNMNVAFQIVPT